MSDNDPAQHSPNYGGWASFEVEIRARRYARCLQGAQGALDAGNIEEAKDWIAEGRLVSFASPELDELERRISTRSHAPIAAPSPWIPPRETLPLTPVTPAKEEVGPEPLELGKEQVGLREQVLTRHERSAAEDRISPRADVFRRPDPGLEPSARTLLGPADGVLFGSSAAEERREVSWATVLLGMAAAAMLVGAISFGVARFLNGQPIFQLSRDETSVGVDPQPAPGKASQPSTPLQPSASPQPAVPTPTEPKPSEVPVAPIASTEPRVTDASPSPATALGRESAPTDSASTTPDPVRPKPPAAGRDRAARETENATAVGTEPRTASLPPSRPPLSGGRLVLPAPAPPVAPQPAAARPFEPPAAVPTAAGTSGSVPATAPAVTPAPALPAPVSPAPASPVVTPPASPAATPPAPAPSSRSSAESRAEDTASIRVVLARYEAAYNRLDARAASAVWPRVNEGALDRAFGGLLSQKVALGLCDIAVIGDVAGASCNGKARWEPRIGGGVQTADRSWKFNLRKGQDGWKIEDVLVR